MEEHMLHAQQERQELPFRKGVLASRVSLFSEAGELGTLPMYFSNNEEKAELGRKAACLARVMEATAAVFVTDMMSVAADKICAHFGLRPLDVNDREDVARFEREYLHILKTRFSGTVENLPTSLWDSGLMVAAKGPELPILMLQSKYTDDGNDRVIFQEPQFASDSGHFQFNVIPNWWELPENDPGVVEIRRMKALLEG